MPEPITSPHVVYGYSDDCIEVEGAIREEFYASDDGSDLLTFSTGVVLRISYTTDGVWRVEQLAGDPGQVSIDRAPLNDEDNYSDRCYLMQSPSWLVFGDRIIWRRNADSGSPGVDR